MRRERSAYLRTVAPIAGAVLLAIVALALHPHMSDHAGSQAELREMGSLSTRDRLVHGTLLLLLGMLLTVFTSYALRRVSLSRFTGHTAMLRSAASTRTVLDSYS